jgi:hypothetical protein
LQPRRLPPLPLPIRMHRRSDEPNTPPIAPVRPFSYQQHRRQAPSVSSIVLSAVSAGSLERVALASPPLAPARSTTRPRQSSSPFRGTPDPYSSHQQQHHVATDKMRHNHSPYGSPSRKALNLASRCMMVRRRRRISGTAR